MANVVKGCHIGGLRERKKREKEKEDHKKREEKKGEGRIGGEKEG